MKIIDRGGAGGGGGGIVTSMASMAEGRVPTIVLRDTSIDMVNHPPHYERGPQIECPECGHVRTLQHIEVFRYIKDSRLATAFKYIWRVAFGGKDSGNTAKDVQDIGKAGFYLKDFEENPV